jgi:serine/threonine protein phosphatase PrpC
MPEVGGSLAFWTSRNSLRIDIGAGTDVGRVRDSNEDSFRIVSEQNLFILADGLGGAAHGEIASTMAVEAIAAHCQEAIQNPSLPLNGNVRDDLSDKTNRLVSAVLHANRMIYDASLADDALHGMATTVVGIWVDQERLSLAHVGDSRVYRLHAGHFEQLTCDHSVVAEQVRIGMITREDAEQSPLQTMLTRALGTQANVEVDVEEYSISTGDSFLLCSDGLSRMVSDEIIAHTIENSTHAQGAAERLIELAREAGGSDNITVVLLQLKLNGLRGWRRLWRRRQHA